MALAIFFRSTVFLQQGCLTGLRRRHDQSALPLSDGRNQINRSQCQIVDARRLLQTDARVGIDGRKVFKPGSPIGFLRRTAIDGADVNHRHIAIALALRARLALHVIAHAQAEPANLRDRHVHVVRARQVVFGSKEAIPIRMNFQNARAVGEIRALRVIYVRILVHRRAERRRAFRRRVSGRGCLRGRRRRFRLCRRVRSRHRPTLGRRVLPVHKRPIRHRARAAGVYPSRRNRLRIFAARDNRATRLRLSILRGTHILRTLRVSLRTQIPVPHSRLTVRTPSRPRIRPRLIRAVLVLAILIWIILMLPVLVRIVRILPVLIIRIPRLETRSIVRLRSRSRTRLFFARVRFFFRRAGRRLRRVRTILQLHSRFLRHLRRAARF